MSDQPSEQLSPTAQESSGILGLGKTGGQRSAEMLAGIRAELMPKPEYIAMSRPAGRIIGSMLVRLVRGDQAKLRVVIARPEVFRYLVTQHLESKANAHYVELASGFLPRAWQMASEFPHLRVTEVDLPDVIAEKQRRFAAAKLPLPPNLRMLSADLGTKSLAEALEGEKADVISAEGLLPYFPLDTVQRIGAGVRQSLKDGGVFIADIMPREAFIALTQSKIRQAVNIFRRNAGNWEGIVDDADHARRLFEAVGYSRVEVRTMPEVAEQLPHLPKPIAVLNLIIMAYN